MPKEYPIYVAGELVRSERPLKVTSPYDDSLVGTTYLATAGQLEAATQSAQAAFKTTSKLPAYERSRILARIREGVQARQQELARTIALEAGKPLKDATGEVNRALLTLETAVEEAKRVPGELLPLDVAEHAKGRLGIVRRYPIGPIVAITPFNFPLNLAMHKLAPAIAVGNTVVMKPPSKDPLTMLTVAEIIAQSGLPAGAVSIMPMGHVEAERMVADERFKLLTFTGSAEVGWSLKQKAGKKRALLELGGNAGVIVDRDANLEYAVPRIAWGSFTHAGQSCISVQRIFVHEDIYDAFSRALVAQVAKLKLGDPLDPETDVGPLIDDGAAARTRDWVAEAIGQGARALTGGKGKGRLFEPTVLTNVDPQAKVCRLEVFAPVVNLFPFSDFREAVRQVNDTMYGLQAGVFTRDLEHVLYAFDELEVGGIIVNDIPTYRVDPMPYGGVKESGQGREGLRYVMEEMTEPKLLLLKLA